MKANKLWQQLLLIAVLAPYFGTAQTYNNVYLFPTQYFNSVHTDAVQLKNGDLAEGGTILNSSSPGQNMVQVGVVDPSGFMYSPSFFYADPNAADLSAVDMVESFNSDYVVQVANYREPGGMNRIEVFETDPYNGNVSWAMRLGVNMGEDLFGAAIISDKNNYYYVLGFMRDGTLVVPYLAQLDNSGAVMWEFLYYDSNWALSNLSVDLVYHREYDRIIFTANSLDISTSVRMGIMTVEVDASSGNYISASHTPKLAGTEDFVVRDITITPTAEYVLVGQINNTPVDGFLLRYLPNLTPAAPFSVIYTKSTGIFMTGVKPYAGGGLFVSYEWGINMGSSWGSMAQLSATGVPILPQSFMYFMRNSTYMGSTGLIPLNGNQDFAVKGAHKFAGSPALSIFADFTAIVNNSSPPACNEPIDFRYYFDNTPDPYDLFEENLETYEEVELEVNDVIGEMYDCDANWIGNFRLAAPTGIANSNAIPDLKLYPNPTDGKLIIEIPEAVADLYTTAEIFNALGDKVITFNVNGNLKHIDLSDQAPGIYLLRMKGNDGNMSAAHRIMIR